jgi:CRP/FNR family transcriptional regulator
MSVSAANGKTVVLHLFFPGSLFPLLSLAGQDQQHYELEALTPIEVRMIPFAVFQKQLKSHPELSYLLLTRLAAGLDRMTLRLQQNLSNTPQQQLASLLLYFVRHQEHSTNSSPLITITHQDLADWLGLSRENVSLQLGKLVAQGILKTGHGWISVTNLVALQKLTT